MHQSLISIGFHTDSEKEIQSILNKIEENYSYHNVMSYSQDYDLCEYEQEITDHIGMQVQGFLDENEDFVREQYQPYFRGTGITSYSDITVEKVNAGELYKGICEDIKVNISLIFHLINSMEYMREKQLGNIPKRSTSVTLSGLADNGMILFPILKSREEKKSQKEKSRNRMMLLSAAQNGDTSAMESLTLEDMRVYSEVSKRIVKEDVFTIVDTYIMPYGVECDKYSVMGEILSISKEINKFTKETLYILTIDVNELCFDICIPERKLHGIPEIGRRFKGTIWMQGVINF